MRWGEQYSQKPVAMSLAEANQLLAGPHSTEEAIRAGYAAALRAAHSDTGGSGDGALIARVKTARDVLLAYLNQGQEITCKLCGGSGRVIGTGFGAPCPACQGQGIVNG